MVSLPYLLQFVHLISPTQSVRSGIVDYSPLLNQLKCPSPPEGERNLRGTLGPFFLRLTSPICFGCRCAAMSTLMVSVAQVKTKAASTPRFSRAFPRCVCSSLTTLSDMAYYLKACANDVEHLTKPSPNHTGPQSHPCRLLGSVAAGLIVCRSASLGKCGV